MTKKEIILSEIKEALKSFDVEKIILFGSFAYGNPDDESDIDLLLIKDIPADNIRDFRLKVKLELWDIIAKWKIPIDIIVDNNIRIKQRIKDGDMFYSEILTKGNTIYA
ncbi:MAG: nucleotidyltransferase domain-containing protein [FCB group bacterium]|nr:nucleotidyltransferase domain-containing protein [FCB group bacterium]